MQSRPESLASGRGPSLLHRVLEGYRHLFSLVAGVLPLLLGIVVISGVIVLPLWYLATEHRSLFSGIVLILGVGGGLFFIIRGILRRRQGRHVVARSLLSVASLGAIYLGIRLLAFGLYLPAILLLLVAIFLTGLSAAPKRRV